MVLILLHHKFNGLSTSLPLMISLIEHDLEKVRNLELMLSTFEKLSVVKICRAIWFSYLGIRYTIRELLMLNGNTPMKGYKRD
jgi:hypothetical protein